MKTLSTCTKRTEFAGLRKSAGVGWGRFLGHLFDLARVDRFSAKRLVRGKAVSR